MVPSMGGRYHDGGGPGRRSSMAPRDKVDKQSGRLEIDAASSRQPGMEAPLGLDLSGRWPVRSGGRPGAWPGWSWKPGLWFVGARCVPAGSLRSVMRHPRQPVGSSRPTGRRTSLVGRATQGFRHPEGACGDAGSDGGPARRTGDMELLPRKVRQQLATHRGSVRDGGSFRCALFGAAGGCLSSLFGRGRGRAWKGSRPMGS